MDNIPTPTVPTATQPPKSTTNLLPIFIALTGIFFATSVIFALLYFSASANSLTPPTTDSSLTPAPPASDNSGVTDSPTTLTGKITCLPKKSTSDQTTLECALGLQTDNGNYYSLSDPEMKYVSTLSGDETVTISGVLSQSPDSPYDIVGVIEIQSLTK